MRLNTIIKRKPGAMCNHRSPGIGSTLSKVFTMRTIQRHHCEIHLPLFAWADARQRSVLRRLLGYYVDNQLNVTPIWSEVKHV